MRAEVFGIFVQVIIMLLMTIVQTNYRSTCRVHASKIMILGDFSWDVGTSSGIASYILIEISYFVVVST